MLNLQLFVPYSMFGDKVNRLAWDNVHVYGPMAGLPFWGAMRFFWYSLQGWCMVGFDNGGVLFEKPCPVVLEDE